MFASIVCLCFIPFCASDCVHCIGHQYILREFGADANPTVGWQLDPFGHSATQPSLLGHEIGFHSLFFGRIDYQDHQQRLAAKEAQFFWAPSPSLGADSGVWTEVAYDGSYEPPHSFCWDIRCVPYTTSPQVQDRPDLEDMNVDERVADFIRAAYQYFATRKGDMATTNIQFNMGNDFNYMNAERYYINMDKIIRAVNRNGTIHAQYSTPSLYYEAKMKENIQWSRKTDDFFPCQQQHPHTLPHAHTRVACPANGRSADASVFSLVYMTDRRLQRYHAMDWVLHLSSGYEGIRALIVHPATDRTTAGGVHWW